MRTLTALALLAGSSVAQAQQIDITLNQQATDAGLDEQAIEDQLNGIIEDQLNLGTDARHQEFIDSMVEAAAISSKGIGVDYASNMKKFVFGGSFSSGVAESGFRFNRGKDLMPKGGYGAQITLMAGLNLGMGGEEPGFWDRIRLYANGLAMRLPSDREIGGQMANAGGHVQVKLINGPEGKIVEWGGLDLTSGFEYSAYSFDLRQNNIPVEAPLGGDGSVTWTANGAYNINSDILSVPVELSSNVRIAIATVYLGGAYDTNIGTGTSRAELSGPVNGRLLAPDGSTYDGQLGTATVSAAADGTALPGGPRLFLGAQVNALVLKGFGHLNVAPLQGAVGGHVGIRIAL